MSHDNDNWDNEKYVHYCKLGVCPCECKDAADSLGKAKAGMRLSLGMGMVTAEIYRWKGVEEANCYHNRGRCQHELFSNALKMQWDRKACDAAMAKVEAAADSQDIDFSTMNSAKAGFLLRDMATDPNNETAFRSALLTSPVQRFLNATMQADKFACDFVNKQSLDPDGVDTQQARTKLFKANMSFFNGSRGKTVLQGYMGMILDLNGTAWEGWRGDDETKLKYAAKLAVPMVGAWRRLVVPFTADDAFRLMAANSDADGLEIKDDLKLKALGRQLEGKLAACEDCVDQDFAAELLPFIDTDIELVHKACGDNAVMLRVGSGVVERAHIAGQDLKPLKSRGIALDGQALAMNTYRKSVIGEGRWMSHQMKTQVLKERNLSAEAVARHSNSFRFGKSSNNTCSRSKKLRILGGQQKVGLRRCVDGYKKFRRGNWSVKAVVGTPEFIGEEKRLSEKWSQMSEAGKALWEAESKAENTVMLSLPSNANIDDVNAAAAAGGLSDGRKMAMRREAVASALEAMSSHSAWDSGLGLHSMSSALKPEYVTNDSIATCRTFMKDHFAHDVTIVENPKGSKTSLSMPCAIKNRALCSKDLLLKACTLGSENIYKQLKSDGVGRGQFPIIAKLSVLPESVYVLITDTVGKGETVLTAILDYVDEVWSLKQVAGANGSIEPQCAFSQQIIHELLGRAAAKNNADPTAYSSMAASFIKPIPCSSGGKLAFRSGSEKLCEIPLDSAIAVKHASEAKTMAASGPCGLKLQAFSDTPLTTKQLRGSVSQDEDHVPPTSKAKKAKVDAGSDADSKGVGTGASASSSSAEGSGTKGKDTGSAAGKEKAVAADASAADEEMLDLEVSHLMKSGTPCQVAANLASWPLTSHRQRQRSAGYVKTKASTRMHVLSASISTDFGTGRNLARPGSPCMSPVYLIPVSCQPSLIQ